MADNDKDRPQVTLSSNSNEPPPSAPTSPLEKRAEQFLGGTVPFGAGIDPATLAQAAKHALGTDRSLLERAGAGIFQSTSRRDESLRGDLERAAEEIERKGDGTATPEPPPAGGHDALPKNWVEAVPAILFGFYGFAFAFEAVVAMNEGHGTLVILDSAACLVCAAIAISWWKRKDWLPQKLVMTTTSLVTDARWLLSSMMLLLMVSALSPYVEQHRWPFLNQIWTAAIPKQATPSTPIVLSKPLGGQKIVTATELIEKVDSLQSQLDATNLELKAARQPSGSLGSLGNITPPTLPTTPLCLSGNCPPTPSLGGNIFAIPSADKVAELEAAVQKLEDENRRLEKERQAALAPKPSPAQSGPIIWSTDGQLFVVGGDAVHSVHAALFRGTSTTLVTIKEAYAISGLTGRRQELKANVTNRGLYDVDKVDIPPQAAVQLDLVWNPPIPLKDFVDQWGKFHITIAYNGIKYEREFDENYVRQKIREQSPDAFGPRVTPRDDK